MFDWLVSGLSPLLLTACTQYAAVDITKNNEEGRVAARYRILLLVAKIARNNSPGFNVFQTFFYWGTTWRRRNSRQSSGNRESIFELITADNCPRFATTSRTSSSSSIGCSYWIGFIFVPPPLSSIFRSSFRKLLTRESRLTWLIKVNMSGVTLNLQLTGDRWTDWIVRNCCQQAWRENLKTPRWLRDF